MSDEIITELVAPEALPLKKAPRKPRPSEIAKKAAKKTKAKAKGKIKTIKPSGLVLSRSYQRGGKVGAGLERPSGSMQATIVFEARQFKKLQVVARKNGVSFSEQVRQCVSTALAA